MDALIMAGGRGTRLDTDVEKPLFEVGGIPMVDSVVRALAGADTDRVVAAVSPHAPATRSHLTGVDEVTVVETPGDGYVADLDVALEAVDDPALTAAADLPLLDPTAVDRILDVAETVDGSLTVCVPAALKRRLGASVDTTIGERAPTGVNVVADAEGNDSEQTDSDRSDTMYTSYDVRLAINVNRRSDARLAEALRCE